MPDGSYRYLAPTHVLTLANVVSLARLCSVPAVVWLVLRQDFAAAFWLFAVAGASDAVDGWLARRRGPSAVGAVLDPLADKAMLISLFVALAATRVLPDWLAILVVFRDVLIMGGVLALSVLGHRVAIRPIPISKINTVVQVVLVMAALLGAAYGNPIGAWKMAALVWLTAATTIASGAAYLRRGAGGP